MSDPLSPARNNLDALIARARTADGSPPFSDGSLVELSQGTARLDWLGECAAIVSGANAEFVVDPDARSRGLGTRMLEHLTSTASGEMLFWAHGDHPAARALAASHGLEPVRELLHLEAPVPQLPPSAAPVPALPPRAAPAPELPPSAVPATEIATSAGSAGSEAAEAAISPTDREHSRPSTDGIDAIRLPEEAAAWLELNARAFAGHPEQGGMTRADLDTTAAEPWFDADDFLVLRDAGAIVGFCWLKVEGPEGEFYVVGVDPDRQGERLGHRLVAAGMARLADRGIRTAHLYVEGDNTAALRLYRGFGFTNRSVDVQYRWSRRA